MRPSSGEAWACGTIRLSTLVALALARRAGAAGGRAGHLSVPDDSMSGVTANEFAEAAHTHLPAELADRWIATLRPGLHLRPATPGEPVACRLGGNPRLPEATPWPEWPEHGPLTFIAEVDCAALPHGEFEPAFPATGSLLFFFFDGQLDDRRALVHGSVIDSQPGARVLYIEPGAEVAERSAPAGIRPYPGPCLAGDIVLTIPDCGHPDAVWAITDPDAEALFDPEFTSAVHIPHRGPRHQLAGHAHPIQGAVEYEVAVRSVTSATPAPSPDEEAYWAYAPVNEWHLLAQFDTDSASEMMWGDGGTLYWLITADDLVARRFDRARMTWQCH